MADRSRSPQVAEVLIAYGADTHARDRDLSRTALHVAAAMGHDNVLRTLITRGALLDTADRNCATALILAVKAGHVSSVALLAAAGADWSVADHSGMTALHHACKAGNEEVVRALLRHGCDPNMPEHDAAVLAPLSLATACAKAGVMRALLDSGADIDHVDCEQRNALLWAIHRTAASPAPLQLLVDMGADVSILARLGRDMRLPNLATALPVVLQARRGGRGLLHTNPEVEWNPLVDAVMQRDVHAVRLVLSLHGSRAYGPALAAAAVAALHAGDVAVVAALLPTGAAAAELAESELVTRSLEEVGHASVVEVLRQRGVLQLCRSMGVVVPLHTHAEAGRVDIIRMLVATGVADVHAQCGRDTCTALFHCTSAAAAEALLAVGAHVDARDAGGRTPLMVCKGVDVVRVLLAHGAAVAAVDAEGRSALHAAASCGEYSKLRALLQHDRAAAGALVAAADRSGSLPLHAALRAPLGGVECIDELLAADPHAATTVNARDAQRRTPLLLATEAGRHSAVRYLAVHGADIGARDARMRNAAGAAALALDLRMLRFVLQCGGRLDSEVAADCLVKAVEEGEEGVALLLLEQLGGAEVDDRLLLAEACLAPMPRLVAKLLDRGADPDEADDEGLTVLHELCEAAAEDG
jgi:ankyrin repeat protein